MTTIKKASETPFPLSTADADPAGQWPLPLGRKKPSLDDNPPSKPQGRPLSACFGVKSPPPRPIQQEWHSQQHAPRIAAVWMAATPQARVIQACKRVLIPVMNHLQRCQTLYFQPNRALQNDVKIILSGVELLTRCARLTQDCARPISHCRHGVFSAPRVIRQCQTAHYGAAFALTKALAGASYGRDVKRCWRVVTPAARLIPCQYFPPPEAPFKPPDQPIGRCGIKPDAAHLPFPIITPHFDRSSHLPLPLSCWNSKTRQTLYRRTYLMKHTFSAKIDGQPAELLSLSIQAGVDGYCWQCSFDLPPSDFLRLELDKRTEPALLEITINDYEWQFLIEGQYRDNRRHAAHGGRSYSLTGRSQTAQLGAFYARAKEGIIASSRYARQIATEQLTSLPFTIEKWAVGDWLIPANSYTITGKTPIAVIGDIAAAAGGFVYSHRAANKLDILPLWPNPAWRLGEPQQTIPASAIISISGQKRDTPRANSVRIIPEGGGNAAYVYREGTDGQPALPDLLHPLYSDLKVWQAAGMVALSETGKHKDETLELPFAPQHGLPLAQLGEVWRIDELNAEWDGVVRRVEIRVKRESNGAISTRQTVTLDRYLDL